MVTKLVDLKLKPGLLALLTQLGHETVEDLIPFSNMELLRMPGMGGRDWRKVARAMGREMPGRRK